MAIKLAFSTVACPDWTLEQVAQKAREFGYQGVELRTLGPGSTGLASDPALSEPQKVRKALSSAGIEPVCLSTSTSLHYKSPTEAYKARWQTIQDFELAAAIGCPMVRVFAHKIDTGTDRRSALKIIAHNVNELTTKASELGVQLVLENAGSMSMAKEWWWLLNLVNHPLVGLSWNVANAAAASEPPSVSVSMLNSRIRLAKVKDTIVGEGSGFVPLGEGTVGIEQFIKRLLGVGFEGYVSVEWDRLWLPSLAPADEYLPDAHKRLKTWLDTIATAGTEGRESYAKFAQKNIPMAKAGLHG